MERLRTLECAMERWAAALWGLVLPQQHHQMDLVLALRRHCNDRALILDRRRVLVPNVFVVELPPDAHCQLAYAETQLGSHLVHQVHRHAAERGYTFAGPVQVRLQPVDCSPRDRFVIRSRILPLV
ncbi:FhaA domain-containing protein [Streptomyces sp. NPDC050738]|uniref:FhaA domain-containing protein n=1 Tax=Streptomyces sp. NPDC050738 TaxID=3154744 RepID=UPI00341A18E0